MLGLSTTITTITTTNYDGSHLSASVFVVKINGSLFVTTFDREQSSVQSLGGNFCVCAKSVDSDTAEALLPLQLTQIFNRHHSIQISTQTMRPIAKNVKNVHSCINF